MPYFSEVSKEYMMKDILYDNRYMTKDNDSKSDLFIFIHETYEIFDF